MPSRAQVDRVESLPGSDASAIPVDHDDPHAAAGPLHEAPGDLGLQPTSTRSR